LDERTDPFGKLALYQLSYARESAGL
jgi:hypothetical protein